MIPTRQFSDLRTFLNILEATGNLVHFREELSTWCEIPAAMEYIARHMEKTVIFDRVKGYGIPVVGNLFVSRKNLAIAFGVREDELEEIYLARAENPIKPEAVGSGSVQEVIIKDDIDIQRNIPVLTYHEKDAGPYMTSAVTIAKDPETGMRGMGVHRIQIKSKDTIGIFLANPPLSDILTKSEAAGEPLDIAIVTGVDPLTFCAAIFPAPKAVDKFDIAGGFAQAPVDLLKCCSVDLEVPANAEFVLEGQIIPRLREKEGPFGESTGYYFTFDSPVAKITAITHRSKPIYDGLVPFGGEGQMLAQIMIRPYLLKTSREAVPDVRVQNLSTIAIGGLCVVQIDKKSEDDALKVINHLLPAPRTKIVVVVDEDVNISEMSEIIWAIVTRVRPDKDLIIKSGLPGLVIDPSVGDLGKVELGRLVGRSAKLGIDATKPLKELPTFERIGVPAEVNEKIIRLMEVIK
ncbi:UbiD family decarboxylase [Chloroflexota bacterium]